MTENTQADQSLPKKPRDRSPSFPFIPLKTAVERLIQLDNYIGRHPGRVGKAGLAWKMKEGSSQAGQTLAALKAFGFTKYSGSGKGRTVEISGEGRTYLRAQQEGIKKSILEKAARKPKGIQKFWSIWGADRPPDPICLDELTLNLKYTPDAAKLFLKVYDETIAYAGLSDSDKIHPGTDDSPDGGQNEAVIGDVVQWKSGGVYQFEAPRRVRAIQGHEGQDWVFVDGNDTGIPMSEVSVLQKATDATPVMQPPVLPEEPSPAAPGKRKEVTSLDEGDATLVWPEEISADSYGDFEAWLKGIMRKARRRAGVEEPSPEQ